MARAWEIARQRREEVARRAYDGDVKIIGGRIIHNRPLSAFIAETPIDLGAAMRQAWQEARNPESLSSSPTGRALVVMRPTAGALAPLRRMRMARVFRLLSGVARWIGERFIPARAA